MWMKCACVYACMRNIAYKIKVLKIKHYERIFEQTRSRAGEAGCRPCGGVCRGPRGVGGTWHLWWPIGRIDVELLIPPLQPAAVEGLGTPSTPQPSVVEPSTFRFGVA